MNHIANNRILNAMLLSPDLTISAVSNRQSELILLLNTINSRLSNAPDGTLRIAKRGNAHQYYHRTCRFYFPGFRKIIRRGSQFPPILLQTSSDLAGRQLRRA